MREKLRRVGVEGHPFVAWDDNLVGALVVVFEEGHELPRGLPVMLSGGDADRCGDAIRAVYCRREPNV